MDAAALKILGGLALCATGLAGLWAMRHRMPRAASPVGEMPMHPQVLATDADHLLAPYRGRLRAIQERSRFSLPSFERDVLTLLRRLLAHPRGTPTRANTTLRPGPEIGQALALAHCALGLRQAMLLPPGAQVEDIEPRSFRWTYGVLLAALLHELRTSATWAATATGDLRTTLQPWLDPATLQWLLEDAQLVEQLQAFLASPTGNTVFHEILAQALASLERAPAPERKAKPPIDPKHAPVFEATQEASPPAVVEPTPEDLPPLAPPRQEAAPVAPGVQLARSFIDWLRAGLAERSIASNVPGAQVHFVSDGMVLVVPPILQTYAASQAEPGTDLNAYVKELQKAVVAEAWHLRGPQGAHLHRFAQGGGQAVVRGLLIASPQRFVAAVPPPNPALSRLM